MTGCVVILPTGYGEFVQSNPAISNGAQTG